MREKHLFYNSYYTLLINFAQLITGKTNEKALTQNRHRHS